MDVGVGGLGEVLGVLGFFCFDVCLCADVCGDGVVVFVCPLDEFVYVCVWCFPVAVVGVPFDAGDGFEVVDL